MENNNDTIEGLLKFAKVAEDTMSQLRKDIEHVKKGLTPEQRADLDKELEKNDLDSATKELSEAIEKFKKTTFNQ